MKNAPLLIIVLLLLNGNPALAKQELPPPLKQTNRQSQEYQAGYEAGKEAAMQEILEIEKKAQKKERKTRIYLGGVLMTLGITEKTLIPKVQKRFQVKQEKNKWRIIRGDTKETVGLLTFKNGKLSSALKVWASDNDHEMITMGDALFQVFEGLTKKEKENLRIKTSSEQKSANLHKSVLITAGKKIIRIRVITGRGWNQVDVHEIL